VRRRGRDARRAPALGHVAHRDAVEASAAVPEASPSPRRARTTSASAKYGAPARRVGEQGSACPVTTARSSLPLAPTRAPTRGCGSRGGRRRTPAEPPPPPQRDARAEQECCSRREDDGSRSSRQLPYPRAHRGEYRAIAPGWRRISTSTAAAPRPRRHARRAAPATPHSAHRPLPSHARRALVSADLLPQPRFDVASRRRSRARSGPRAAGVTSHRHSVVVHHLGLRTDPRIAAVTLRVPREAHHDQVVARPLSRRAGSPAPGPVQEPVVSGRSSGIHPRPRAAARPESCCDASCAAPQPPGACHENRAPAAPRPQSAIRARNALRCPDRVARARERRREPSNATRIWRSATLLASSHACTTPRPHVILTSRRAALAVEFARTSSRQSARSRARRVISIWSGR